MNLKFKMIHVIQNMFSDYKGINCKSIIESPNVFKLIRDFFNSWIKEEIKPEIKHVELKRRYTLSVFVGC